jgi:hypothetical protein
LSISTGRPLISGSRKSPTTRLHGRNRPGYLMAITDIAAYAHLSDADIDALGYELDVIRALRL